MSLEIKFSAGVGSSIGKKHAPPLACLSARKLEESKIYVADIYKERILDNKSSTDDKERKTKQNVLIG